MMRVALTWVSQVSPKLAHATWLTGHGGARAATGARGEPPAWQPLFFLSGADMRTFELELRWAPTTLAATLGTLRIQCAPGETLCAEALEVLQSIGTMLQSAIEDIEQMDVGHRAALASVDDFSSAFDATRLLLPAKLLDDMRRKLRKLAWNETQGELIAYKVPDTAYVAVMASVLALLGRRLLTKWEDVRAELTRNLFDEMMALDPSAVPVAELRRRCAAALEATRGVDLDAKLAALPRPVQNMGKWMIAIRFVMHVVITIEEEKELASAAAPAPEAESVPGSVDGSTAEMPGGSASAGADAATPPSESEPA